MRALLIVLGLLSAAPGRVSAGEGAALERGLLAVRAENIRADVHFLASDELQGRDTPSAGLRLAARYLRARLERLGFQPAGDDGFFDRYPLERAGLDLEASRVWIQRGGEEQELVFGEAYAFFGGGEHDLAGGVVFAGSGSEEDLRGRDFSGRWALVLDGESGRGRGDRSERAARAQRVQATGALGILTSGSPDAADAAERDAGLARMASFARQPGLRAPGDAGPSWGDFPALYLASTAARALLGSNPAPDVGRDLGVRLRELRKPAPKEVFELENVAGLWPGSDPELRAEVIVLSAHYDHVGVHDGVVYNGADDNGSGTSGLLAVAEALVELGPLRRSVLFLWVSGEEKGLLGSAAWTREPTLPAGMRAVCNLNLDMIGRNAPDKLLITPTRELEEYNGLTRLAESLAPLEGFPALGGCDEYWQRSDQMNFAENLEIPVAFLFSDVHEDYHQPTDDPEKIDYDKIRRVARLVLRMLDGLQADTLAL